MPDMLNLPEGACADALTVVIPIFNDWESLARLLTEIDATLRSANLRGRVTLVDDGSTVPVPDKIRCQNFTNVSSLEVVRLLSNLGHQRAITAGIAHLNRVGAGTKAIVVMDGDGQDRAEDIPRLLEELAKQHCDVVFAARAKRSEEFAFRLMYFVYRLVHRLLTGTWVRWGNFSAISFAALPGLLACPDLWNHYAGGIVRTRVRFSTVDLPRGQRYCGESHMRYSSLVTHGLSAIGIYSEIVGVRLMILCSEMLALLLVVFGVGLFGYFDMHSAYAGWGAVASGVLGLFALQGLISALLFTLITLAGRSRARVVPLRDAEGFVESVVRLYPVGSESIG